MYLGHVPGSRGVDLFRLACERDLEGVVAKLARSAYRMPGDYSPWIKIRRAPAVVTEGRGRE